MRCPGPSEGSGLPAGLPSGLGRSLSQLAGVPMSRFAGGAVSESRCSRFAMAQCCWGLNLITIIARSCCRRRNGTYRWRGCPSTLNLVQLAAISRAISLTRVRLPEGVNFSITSIRCPQAATVHFSFHGSGT
jgi:hypothetical protein